MAENKINTGKVPSEARLTDVAGENLQTGVYEAIVKEVLDGNRTGRLKVWMPELGTGDQEDPQGWVTVGYASPFMGKTKMKDPKSTLNDFEHVEHTYGFWAVPPDVGNHVLVMFVNGDRNRGFYFACVLDRLGRGMLPGLGGGYKEEVDDTTITDPDVAKAFKGSLDPGKMILPLSEVQESDGGNIRPGAVNIKRPLHEYQAKRYFTQGLDRDNLRGARKTGSQADTVNSVYGFSTPGRPYKNDAKDDGSIAAKLDSGEYSDNDINADGRKGGHHIVMDDGRFKGGGEMIRIRSAEGHQLLMDDEKGSLYMINSEGTCWVEMAKSGHLSIYTAKGINIRSDDIINMHTEKSINMYAKEDINIKAKVSLKMEGNFISSFATLNNHTFGSVVLVGAAASLNLSSLAGASLKAGKGCLISGASVGLNSGSGPTVPPPLPLKTIDHDDTVWNDGVFQWEIKPAILQSIVTIAPTHEPWKREAGEYSDKNATATSPSIVKVDTDQQ